MSIQETIPSGIGRMIQHLGPLYLIIYQIIRNTLRTRYGFYNKRIVKLVSTKIIHPCSGGTYQSPNVITTTPLIDSEIATRRPTIDITYNIQVKPATGNVTIYATDGVKKYFRQSYSPISFQYCQL